MVLAGIFFIRITINLLKSSKKNAAYWIGIGLIGSIIAGLVFAMLDVTPTITYVTGTVYLSGTPFTLKVRL